MLLPTVPTFGYQSVPTATVLNELAGAVSFVANMPIVISLKLSATQSVAAATPTAVAWNVSEVDSDSMHSTSVNPSRLVAQTQGYYRLHATIAMSNVTSKEYQAYFRQTTGSSNPLGAGITQVFGGDASESSSSGSDTPSIGIRSLTPCLYTGDYVEVMVFAASACTLQYNYGQTGTTDNAGNHDGACCLYGYYAFEGP
jgi:hypothetical protein